MNTQISSKLAAFAVAILMNAVLVVGVASLFNGRIDHHGSAMSTFSAALQTPHLA